MVLHLTGLAFSVAPTGSYKILITAVWAHEVHHLLTYCSTSGYQTSPTPWWHVRVSPVESTNASAREAIELLGCETSDFISPDLWSPATLTSIRSITSSGGLCNSRSIRRRSRMWMNSRSTGWNLDWSGAEHYWHCYQQMEKTSVCLCSREGPTFQTFTVGSSTTGQLDKLSARVTEM